MSDIVAQNSLEGKTAFRFVAILIVVAVLFPHTLEITKSGAIDYSYLRVAFYAAFWMVSSESGSTISGPYSTTLFEIFTIRILVFSILTLPFYLLVIIAQRRFLKGTSSKKTLLRVVVSTLIVQLFILFGFMSYQVDGWLFAQAYPLPILHVLVFLSIVRHRDVEPR